MAAGGACTSLRMQGLRARAASCSAIPAPSTFSSAAHWPAVHTAGRRRAATAPKSTTPPTNALARAPLHACCAATRPHAACDSSPHGVSYTPCRPPHTWRRPAHSVARAPKGFCAELGHHPSHQSCSAHRRSRHLCRCQPQLPCPAWRRRATSQGGCSAGALALLATDRTPAPSAAARRPQTRTGRLCVHVLM